MTSASHAVEYFTTLGRSKSLACKSFAKSDSEKARSPSELWNDAITEIAIVHPGEKVPAGWEIINSSVDGNLIEHFIAVKRRTESPRLDHITKVCKNYCLYPLSNHNNRYSYFKLLVKNCERWRCADTWIRDT